MRLSLPLRLPVILLLAAVLAGCGPARTLTPAPTFALPLPRTSTPSPVATAPFTVTPPPTQTAVPEFAATVTVIVTPTLAPTATPDAALAQVKLIGLDWYKNYDMLLSFQFPGPVDPKNYRVTLADKEFACEVLAQYPNRLYCRGQGAKVLAVATARIYPAGSDLVGFEKDIWIPYFNK